MNTSSKWMLGLALLATSFGASAKWDGKAPIICAVTETAVCERSEECTQGPPSKAGIPVFYKVDIQNEVVRSTPEGGAEKASPIATAIVEDQVLALQGIDVGVTWGMTVGLSDGKMVLSAVASGTAYTAFGYCTLI